MTDRQLLLDLGGPILARYLDDPLVTDVTTNDNGTCFLYHQQEGKMEAAHPGFGSLKRFLLAAADAAGKELEPEQPVLRCGLLDVHWRIQATIPPATPHPWMALRKHPETVFPLAELGRQGVFTPEQMEVLLKALDQGLRLFFMGSTGTAKTTVVNSCLHAMRDNRHHAVMLIEDDPEILCTIPDTRRMNGLEGLLTLKDMIEASLRSLPTLLVIGEVRNGATALPMLRAFQSGHGGITTLHAESVDFGLAKIEQLVQEVSTDPQRALIGQVIDLIVHMEHHQAPPRRRCSGILAVKGWNGHAYEKERVA